MACYLCPTIHILLKGGLLKSPLTRANVVYSSVMLSERSDLNEMRIGHW